ncbi:ATP-dependent DNA ligase [Candidatus Micrarchaeota archaeon]|nr:ATP-dependent DNA ligase [Candidatus Micrarchaeota archaeon]
MEFAKIAELFIKLEKTSSRLAVTDDLAKLFAEAKPSEVRKLVYLCQGIVAPACEGIELGMGEKLAMRSISLVSGKKVEEIEKVYRKEGDLGSATQLILQKKLQKSLYHEPLEVGKVYGRLYKIATSSGGGSQELKIKLLAEMLSNAEPDEAKAIIRLVTGNLRMGVGEPTIIDAFSVLKAGDKSLRAELERAFNMRSDLGLVAELFMKEGIEEIRKIKPTPFYPIRPALAERLTSAEQIIEKLGKCAVEGKYDGLRLAVHKKGNRVEIYSRREERITHMFPDLVEAVKKQVSADEIIFEGEAVAYDEKRKKFLPFQATIQRKRKYGIAEKIKEIPLKLFAFELLYLNGRDFTNEPYTKRRETLEKVIKKDEKIQLAQMMIAENAKQMEKYFNECVDAGLEGIIAKDLNQPYVAGARKFAWIKLKKSYSGELADMVDIVIVGYYVGKGKRTEFGFGGILGAIWEPKQRIFKTITKVGTGFTEEQMKQFAEQLGKLKVQEKPKNVISLIEPDVWVQPKVVVTVLADEITRSPIHTCAMKEGEEGLALRFPRLVDMRKDKAPEDATTEEEVLEMFELQRQK